MDVLTATITPVAATLALPVNVDALSATSGDVSFSGTLNNREAEDLFDEKRLDAFSVAAL